MKRGMRVHKKVRNLSWLFAEIRFMKKQTDSFLILVCLSRLALILMLAKYYQCTEYTMST